MDQLEKKDIALLVLGAVLGLFPWLLDKAGIEMPKPWASFLLYLSVPIMAWALARLGWLGKLPLVEGKSVSLATCLLMCAAVLAECGVWMHLAQEHQGFEEVERKWAHYDYTPVWGQTFMNTEVRLDGRAYFHCTFQNVTLLYNGTAPARLDESNNFIGPVAFKTDNPPIELTYILQNFLQRKLGRGGMAEEPRSKQP